MVVVVVSVVVRGGASFSGDSRRRNSRTSGLRRWKGSLAAAAAESFQNQPIVGLRGE